MDNKGSFYPEFWRDGTWVRKEAGARAKSSLKRPDLSFFGVVTCFGIKELPLDHCQKIIFKKGRKSAVNGNILLHLSEEL